METRADPLFVRSLRGLVLMVLLASALPCCADGYGPLPLVRPAKADAPEMTAAVTQSGEDEGLTYDERRTRLMYRLVEQLRATTDPDERRALQIRILPLSGGCVIDPRTGGR